MKQQAIYQIITAPIGPTKEILDQQPVFTYYSNLKKCVEALEKSLAVQGWEHKINYTAVYRAILLKNKYYIDIDLLGQRMIRILINKLIINPNLTLLGIAQNPKFG